MLHIILTATITVITRPWFPYPSVGVAELNPPNYDTQEAFWNFTNITPQLYAFMNATYARGHAVVPNFSTQPTWMYSTNDWSYPEGGVHRMYVHHINI